MTQPKVIVLFSGKRKSGKDHTVLKIRDRIGEEYCDLIRISGPIKTQWANHLNLDLEKLMGDGPYKEQYRADMVKWGEEERKKDYGVFCRIACANGDTSKPIWIVSDIRRKTDLKWFRKNYGNLIKTVRIVSSDEVRAERGWVFEAGVDDAETECDLDDVTTWDFIIQNNDSQYEKDLISIYKFLNSLKCK